MLLFPISCYAYDEDMICDIYRDGEIIEMCSGIRYESLDPFDSAFWTPGDSVIITNTKIINTDEDESVDYLLY
jgi:hypothetical protein